MTHMFDLESEFTLARHDGSVPSLRQMEDLCHKVMLALLEVEAERVGSVHSSSVSIGGAEGKIVIEFCVDAESLADANLIAGEVVHDVIEARLNHRIGESETSRRMDLVPA